MTLTSDTPLPAGRTRITSASADDTRHLGRLLGRRLHPGDLVTLEGPLGAGKTCLVQGLCQGLEVPENAVSPTFVLMVEHQGRCPVLHLDAYRLENLCFDALCDAGMLDFVNRDDAVRVVEWPERVREFLPAPTAALLLQFGEQPEERLITLDLKDPLQ